MEKGLVDFHDYKCLFITLTIDALMVKLVCCLLSERTSAQVELFLGWVPATIHFDRLDPDQRRLTITQDRLMPARSSSLGFDDSEPSVSDEGITANCLACLWMSVTVADRMKLCRVQRIRSRPFEEAFRSSTMPTSVKEKRCTQERLQMNEIVLCFYIAKAM